MRIIVSIICLVLALCSSAQDIRTRRAVESMMPDAVCLYSNGEILKAGEMFGVMLKEDPSNDALHYYYGMCKLLERKLPEAEKHLLKAVELDPSNNWYREALASLYDAQGRSDKSAAIYLELYDKDPKSYTTPFVLSMLGDRELSSYRDTSALEYYRRALDLDPSYPPALLGEAEIYRVRGNYPSFFRNINRFVSDPNILPQARAQYLDNMLQNFDPKAFRTWGAQLDSLVDKGVRVSPRDTSMLKLAGRWYYGTGRKDKGISYFDRLLEASPESMSAHMIRIQLLIEDSRYDEVIEECRKMLSFCEDKDKLTVLSIMGDAFHQTGRTREAYKTYEKVLKIDSGYCPVLNNYAYFLSLEGRKLHKAEKMSRITIAAEPDNPTYLDTYGWILHLLGRDSEAKVHLKRAVVYGGTDSPVVLSHYAEVLRSLGEKDLAKYYESLAERKK